MTVRRTLVLGSTGFIGRHLAMRLLADGHEVAVPVVRNRHHPVPAIQEMLGVTVDALDSDGMSRLVSVARPDIVFNLAAAGVQRPSPEGANLAEGNAGLVTRLLSAGRAGTIGLVVHAGSWSEYGDPTGSALLQEEHPLRPRSPYGVAKAEASTVGASLAAELGIGFVVMRLFNVYGPGEAAHRLLPYLVDRLSRGERVALTPGDQERDFVHVADAVDALVTAAQDPGITAHPAFNVCTGTPTSVAEFSRLVARTVGADSRDLDFGALPPRLDEPQRVVGDPTRLADVTGWRSTIAVQPGIEEAVFIMLSGQRP